MNDYGQNGMQYWIQQTAKVFKNTLLRQTFFVKTYQLSCNKLVNQCYKTWNNSFFFFKKLTKKQKEKKALTLKYVFFLPLHSFERNSDHKKWGRHVDYGKDAKKTERKFKRKLLIRSRSKFSTTLDFIKTPAAESLGVLFFRIKNIFES